MSHMKAAIFIEPGRIVLETKPIPDVGPLDALLRVTTTTICGTDVHILRGEYPLPGLTIGHEPVGRHRELGAAVTASGGSARHRRRDHAERAVPRMSVGNGSQDVGSTAAAARPSAAGASATPSMAARPSTCWSRRQANLAPSDDLTDEQVVLCPDIMSTGFAGAESGGIASANGRGVRPGADRPVRHRGRAADGRHAKVIGVDSIPVG